MNEPVTALTDFVLAAVSLYLGFKLFKRSRFWAFAFVFLGAAALLGGIWHGFWQSDVLWKATTFSVGLASFGMVVGSALQATRGAATRALIGFAALKLAIYAIWIIRHDDFIWVVADTAVALLIVGALYLWRFKGWMLAGVGLSVLAGLAQASGLRLHEHFNHNDLYHVIQIAAMFAFYSGLEKG